MGYGSGMDSCGRCMKFSMVVMNVISFLGGVLVTGLALWILLERSFPSTLMSNNMFVASVWVVMLMGISLAIVSGLGCWGAHKQLKCMLLTYYIIVFIIFVVMLVGGSLLWVFREKVVSSMERQMQASLPFYGNRNEYTLAWDDTQTLLQCCGVKNYRDWSDKIPESCCKEIYPGKRVNCQAEPNTSTIYMDGCLNKVIHFLQNDAEIVGSVAIFVALLMVIALILSCGLFMKID